MAIPWELQSAHPYFRLVKNGTNYGIGVVHVGGGRMATDWPHVRKHFTLWRALREEEIYAVKDQSRYSYNQTDYNMTTGPPGYNDTGYSDNPATVTVFLSQKGPSYTWNHRIEWHSLWPLSDTFSVSQSALLLQPIWPVQWDQVGQNSHINRKPHKSLQIQFNKWVRRHIWNGNGQNSHIK